MKATSASTKKKPAEPLEGGRRIEYMPLEAIQSAARNPKLHADVDLDKSVGRFGYTEPVLLDERTGRLVAGHGRIAALQRLRLKGDAPPEGVQAQEEGGAWLVPVVRGWASRSDQEAEAYLLASNQLTISGGWSEEGLIQMLKELDVAGALDGVGFSEQELNELLKRTDPSGSDTGESGSLAAKFLVPPFSVLDARQGYWQERKRAWLSLGIQSEVGRKENLLNFSASVIESQGGDSNGTSVFDPVICEIAYRWFSAPGALVLDPFSGGSVRGVVCSRLGRTYHGIDLRAEQVAANREQGKALRRPEDPAATWHEGDSRELLASEALSGLEADLIFSCPPYADLEKYSDDPRDLSTMDYRAFLEAYRRIIALAVAKLRPNRFACFVVGEVRDSKGLCYGFVPDTVRAFEDAGAALYNEAILVTSVGSLAMRAARIFGSGRKLAKGHQNVLVFFKGDPRRIKEELGECEVPSEAFEQLEQAEAAASGASPYGEEL